MPDVETYQSELLPQSAAQQLGLTGAEPGDAPRDPAGDTTCEGERGRS